jgi:CheY-like chemotaxis protein
MRFNKSISNNNDTNKIYEAVSSSSSSSPHFSSQTSSSTTTTNNHENSLVHIDTVKVDEKSRLVLTKKAKDILYIQPKDTVVIYHDRINNHVILKVQRGINNNIVDSWILKRNVVVGYTHGYKSGIRSNSSGNSSGSSSSSSIHQHHRQQQQENEEQEYRKPFNIMLIDDEPDVLFTLKTIISSQGYNVEDFADSQEALKRFLQVTNTTTTNKDSDAPSYYKLVITDIRMRALNGVQIYQILKALDKNIKILFISGLDSAEEIISVLPNVTLNDIIRKPIEADSLNQIIQNAILS